MRIGAILAGLVFLFNPYVNIVDVLPDAIGMGLILYGILPLSRTEVNMSEAARYFRNLFILELCKLPALLLYSLVSAQEQLWFLIATMVFGAFEIWFGLAAWNNLFSSLEHLANEQEHPDVLGTLKHTRIMTIVFTIAKPVLAVLPDLSLLSDDRYGIIGINGVQSLKNYRLHFNVLAVLVMLVVGIVWLVMTTRYFKKVRKQENFVALCNEKAAAYYQESKVLPFRILVTGLSFLLFASVFTLELKLEGYSLIPPMIGGGLFLIFCLYTYKMFGKNGKLALWSSVAYLVLSTAGWILSLLFSRKYYNADEGGGFSESIRFLVDRYYDIFDELFVVNLVVLLSQVAFGLMLFFLYRMLRTVVAEYTGNPESMVAEKDKTEEIREREEQEDLAVKAKAGAPLTAFLVTGLITTVSAAIFPLLQIYVNAFFMIDLALRVVFVVVAYSAITRLRRAVKVRGGLDYE